MEHPGPRSYRPSRRPDDPKSTVSSIATRRSPTPPIKWVEILTNRRHRDISDNAAVSALQLLLVEAVKKTIASPYSFSHLSHLSLSLVASLVPFNFSFNLSQSLQFFFLSLSISLAHEDQTKFSIIMVMYKSKIAQHGKNKFQIPSKSATFEKEPFVTHLNFTFVTISCSATFSKSQYFPL